MTTSHSKKGSDFVNRALKDIPGALDDIGSEAKALGADISSKKLSDNELILRMSIVKSVCSLRAGTQISTEETIKESEKLLSWVKSLQ
jgi:hypothetical protein